jgi:hypothetical protein
MKNFKVLMSITSPGKAIDGTVSLNILADNFSEAMKKVEPLTRKFTNSSSHFCEVVSIVKEKD